MSDPCGSIAANLAEGCKRGSPADFARHVLIAEGSASEAHYLVLLAEELGDIDTGPASSLRGELDEIMRMLGALRLTLKAAARAPRRHGGEADATGVP